MVIDVVDMALSVIYCLTCDSTKYLVSHVKLSIRTNLTNSSCSLEKLYLQLSFNFSTFYWLK